MIQPNNKEKEIIHTFFVIWLTLFFVLFYFVLLPIFKDIDFLSNELLFQNKAAELFDIRNKNINDFKKEYKIKSKEIKSIESVFISKEAPIGFIEFLEEEAKKNNLLMKISPMSINQKNNLNWQPVGFRVIAGGDFSDCLKFLSKVERGRWLVYILNVRAERITENNKNEVKGFENLTNGQARIFIEIKTFINEKKQNKKVNET